MSRADRDAAYNNSAAVSDSADWVSRWTEMSGRRRTDPRAILDVPYGPKERNKIDFFPSVEKGAPTLVYIHGGYWQRGAREWYACMGEGVAAHGWSSAIVGYTIAPEARLSEIVAEVFAAIAWVGDNREKYGIGARLILAGWSAGGHLTALGLAAPAIEAGLAISGVYELGPIRDTYLNEKLSLSDEEIASLSPLRLSPVLKPLAIAYGTRELPPLVHDSRALHATRSAAHLAGPLIPLAGCNHFNALDELRKPDGALTRAALDLVEFM
jgi:acetyl esterase/lipase